MKDAAPRIFRSLERQVGQQEFDTVVTAAVAAFSSLRHPTPQQAEELSRLVAPLWNRVGTETRRNLAAALSHTARVPRPVLDLLVAAPLEVSAPFLVSSPALTSADLEQLSTSPDMRIRRLVENRASRGASVEPPLAVEVSPSPAPSPELIREASPPSDRNEIASPSLAADFLSETPLMPSAPRQDSRPQSAASVREALRHLARTGRSHDERSAPPTFGALLVMAMDREEVRFYEGLRAALDLSPETLEAIADDGSGERLAVALKAMKAGAADAMSILMMLKPAIGLSVPAFERLAGFYKNLKAEDCRSLIGLSRLRPSVTHHPLTAAEEFRPMEAPRRDFGRRRERPAERSAKG